MRRLKRRVSGDSPLPILENDEMEQGSCSIKVLLLLVALLCAAFFLVKSNVLLGEEEPEEEAPYMLIMDAGTITLDRLHVLRHNQGIEIKADLRLWNISC